MGLSMGKLSEIRSELYDVNMRISACIAMDGKIRRKEAEEINKQIGEILKKLKEVDT